MLRRPLESHILCVAVNVLRIAFVAPKSVSLYFRHHSEDLIDEIAYVHLFVNGFLL